MRSNDGASCPRAPGPAQVSYVTVVRPRHAHAARAPPSARFPNLLSSHRVCPRPLRRLSPLQQMLNYVGTRPRALGARLLPRTSTAGCVGTILPTLLELRRHRPLLGRRTLLQRCREGAGGPLWVGRRLGGAGEPVCARPLGRAGAACKRARSAEPALSSAGVTQSRMGFLGVLLRFAPRAMFVMTVRIKSS